MENRDKDISDNFYIVSKLLDSIASKMMSLVKTTDSYDDASNKIISKEYAKYADEVLDAVEILDNQAKKYSKMKD